MKSRMALMTLCLMTLGVAEVGLAQTAKPEAAKKGDALTAAASGLRAPSVATPLARTGYDYLLLATNKTSTMQKEMNQAGVEGYRFEGVMGGETAAGGNEAVIVMSREIGSQGKISYEYRLLATRKTSTMQKELQAISDQGFDYKGQTIYDSAFGGREVVVILERDSLKKGPGDEYLLLATNRTSTMQKELNEAGKAGFAFCGITVAETSFGGKEVVTIVRRPRLADR
jgi:hypothetical protein